jgi:DNA-binding response OmpR family regulator
LVSPDEVRLRGDLLRLTPGQVGIVYGIAAGRGKPVSNFVLRSRTSSSDDPSIIPIQLGRARQVMGDAYPIETVRGRGYRWKGAV